MHLEVDGALRSVIQELEQLLPAALAAVTPTSRQWSQLRDAENLARRSGGAVRRTTTAAAAAAASSKGLDVAVQTADPPTAEPEEGACCAPSCAASCGRQGGGAHLVGQSGRLPAGRGSNSARPRGAPAAQSPGDSDSLLEHQRLQHGRLSEYLAQAQFAHDDEAAARADGKDALLGAVLRHLRTVLEAHQAAALVRGSGDGRGRAELGPPGPRPRDGLPDPPAGRHGDEGPGAAEPLRQEPVSRTRPAPAPGSRDRCPGAGRTRRPPHPQGAAACEGARAALPAAEAHYAQGAAGGDQRGRTGVRSAAEARERVSLRTRGWPAQGRARRRCRPRTTSRSSGGWGGDSLLLYWSPTDDQRITGYEISFNRLQQVIRNPADQSAVAV